MPRNDIIGQRCNQSDPVGYDCTACMDGQPAVLIDGKCKDCSELFGQWCTECNDSGCTKCHDDFSSAIKLVNGICVEPNDAFGEGCKKFAAGEEVKCGEAKEGYFIDGKSGLAVSCCALVDENLKTQCCGSCCAIRSPAMSKEIMRDNNIDVIFNNETVKATAVDPNCEEWDSENNKCNKCKSHYTLYGGVCKECSEIHGDSCSECNEKSCTACHEGSGSTLFHGKCVDCMDYIPNCYFCSDIDTCTECADSVVSDGSCVNCQTKYGVGCAKCNSTECNLCMDDLCCPEGTQLLRKKIDDEGFPTLEPFCGVCSDVWDNCINCSSIKCDACVDGMAVDVDNGQCKPCSDFFSECGSCNSEECLACSKQGYILTPNGCVYNDVEPSSSSSGKPVPPPKSSSSSERPLPPPKSSSEGKSNGGMIAGIVIGVIVIVAIVAVAIYCVATSGPKHGKVDASIYEQDVEFESMSVL